MQIISILFMQELGSVGKEIFWLKCIKFLNVYWLIINVNILNLTVVNRLTTGWFCCVYIF